MTHKTQQLPNEIGAATENYPDSKSTNTFPEPSNLLTLSFDSSQPSSQHFMRSSIEDTSGPEADYDYRALRSDGTPAPTGRGTCSQTTLLKMRFTIAQSAAKARDVGSSGARA